MNCKKCGNQLRDNDKFCRVCGEPVKGKSSHDKKPKKLLLTILFAILGILILFEILYIGGNMFSSKKASKGGNIQKDNKKYQALIDSGDKYMENLDYTNAKASYEEAKAIDKKNVAPYIALADLYIETGAIEEAYAVLDEYPTEEAVDDSGTQSEEVTQDAIEQIEEKRQLLDEIKENGYSAANDQGRFEQILKNATDYIYCGNTEYTTSFQRNSSNYQMRVKPPEVAGVIASNMYDYDMDGQMEMMYVTIDSSEESQATQIRIHMLENQDGSWKEVSSIDDIELSQNTATYNRDFFLKKYDDHVSIYVEYTYVGVLATGMWWNLDEYVYDGQQLKKQENVLSFAGSIPIVRGYMELTPESGMSMMEQTKQDVIEFVDRFRELGFTSAQIGYPNMMMDSEPDIRKIARISLSADSELINRTSQWAADRNSSEIEGFVFGLKDFTAE